jgi:5'-3' exonuclease
MLIDGKNAIYRAIFAGYYDQKFKKSGYDYFVITVRFISNYIAIFDPQSVHIFWDAPRKSTWRKELNSDYKEHRAEKYQDLTFDISEELNRHQRLAIEVFRNLNCRQYYRSRMEADDLMYAFCLVNNSNTVIVSSDGDMRQIPYRMNHVRIYNPLQKKKKKDVDPAPTEDIVTMKALAGDSSDNIIGYYNVGPKKSKQMADNPRMLYEFLLSQKAVIKEGSDKKHVGDTLFRANQALVDLSRCPELTANCGYVMSKQDEEVQFDVGRIQALSQEYKIKGLMGDIGRYSHPFKNLR